MMTTTTTSDFGDEHVGRVGQVWERHHARLRRYFLAQLGGAAEADRCVQETIYRFFVFARRRAWEEASGRAAVYVMRIAAVLCSEKLAERRRLAGARKCDDVEGADRRVEAEAVRAVRERLGFK